MTRATSKCSFYEVTIKPKDLHREMSCPGNPYSRAYCGRTRFQGSAKHRWKKAIRLFKPFNNDPLMKCVKCGIILKMSSIKRGGLGPCRETLLPKTDIQRLIEARKEVAA